MNPGNTAEGQRIYPGCKTTAVHPENSFAATLKPSNELTGAMFTLQLPLKFEGLTLGLVSFDINDASHNGSPFP